AFVGVEKAETRITWTSIGTNELYSQMASVSGLLGSVFGHAFAEELVKTLLLSGLTDAQVLDIVNTLAKNVGWLKTLTRSSRVDVIRKITDYVKKGNTAEEARGKVEKESEEYVKNLELEILEFYNTISDTMLANEVEDLLRHVLNTLGPEEAKWLLDLLKRIHSQAGNAGLRIAVEKAFKYPESKTQGCALASHIVGELREKSTEQAWEELNRIVNYPDGIRFRCRLISRGDGLGFRIPVEYRPSVVSYLGHEPCWIKLEVKGRVFYRNYGPSFEFRLPQNVGEVGEEVDITIVKINTYDFVRDIIEKANAPFDISFRSGKYMLIIGGKEVCEISLEKDLHYSEGDGGPAVIFAITDYAGRKHSIKLVQTSNDENLVKVMISQFRRIANMKYDEKESKLTIEYYRGEGETTSEHEVFFENPKTVLVRMAEELRELIGKGLKREANELEGEIGELYAEIYLKEEVIKEKASGILGIPKERLSIQKGHEKWGPDFYIYGDGKLLMIIEIKATRISDITEQMNDAMGQLKKYFTKDKWKDYFIDIKYGISLVIAFTNLDKIIISNFSEGVDIIFGDVVLNPNYKG
ncbi:hypothetical protein, partial [Infirmifilum uzonense]|uniref:hypothetical protein n=1 Tax=Infirmifilum uzonense TaxID=1550241 RepID=UPI003C73681D